MIGSLPFSHIVVWLKVQNLPIHFHQFLILKYVDESLQHQITFSVFAQCFFVFFCPEQVCVCQWFMCELWYEPLLFIGLIRPIWNMRGAEHGVTWHKTCVIEKWRPAPLLARILLRRQLAACTDKHTAVALEYTAHVCIWGNCKSFRDYFEPFW